MVLSTGYDPVFPPYQSGVLPNERREQWCRRRGLSPRASPYNEAALHLSYAGIDPASPNGYAEHASTHYVAVPRVAEGEAWCWRQGVNLRPSLYETAALPLCYASPTRLRSRYANEGGHASHSAGNGGAKIDKHRRRAVKPLLPARARRASLSSRGRHWL